MLVPVLMTSCQRSEKWKMGQSDLYHDRYKACDVEHCTSVAKPARRSLPDHLPLEIETYEPAEQACPQRSGTLCKSVKTSPKSLGICPAASEFRHVRPKPC